MAMNYKRASVWFVKPDKALKIWIPFTKLQIQKFLRLGSSYLYNEPYMSFYLSFALTLFAILVLKPMSVLKYALDNV